MSSGIKSDKENVTAQMDSIGISPEHFSNIQGINQYFEEHRINQLFNVSDLTPLKSGTSWDQV